MTSPTLSSPAVSVCMAAYNVEAFIVDAIGSITSQSFTDLEVVVVDDGSGDGTWDVLKRLESKDQRIRPLRNERNRGLVFTRNRCILEARGRYLAIADADDISEADRLHIQVRTMEQRPSLGALGSGVTLIDSAGARIGELRQPHNSAEAVRFFLMFGPAVHNAASIYRRDVVLAAGCYSDGFDAGAEDYHLWGKMSAISSIINTDDLLVRYRKHPSSMTADRTGVDRNIARISAELISGYLEAPVAPNVAENLHRLLTLRPVKDQVIGETLRVARSIWRAASIREHSSVIDTFRGELAVAAWRQAQYQIYSDRRISLELALFSRTLGARPELRELVRFGGRWVTPDFVRHLIKKVAGRLTGSVAE